MPWSFRRSKKLGPVRINLSKKGVGYSVGGKNFRYRKSATGQASVSSTPVRGLTYRQSLSPPKSHRTPRGYAPPPPTPMPYPAPQWQHIEALQAEGDQVERETEYQIHEANRINAMLNNPVVDARERVVLEQAAQMQQARLDELSARLHDITAQLQALRFSLATPPPANGYYPQPYPQYLPQQPESQSNVARNAAVVVGLWVLR